MAQEAEETGEKDDDGHPIGINGRPEQNNEVEEEEEEEEDDEEEDEPRLKYVSLTKNLRPLYRSGDGTSAFIVGGDKMIIGTHNGNIHILSLPSFKSLRVYHAHSASISSLSISPFPPPLPASKPDAVNRLAAKHRASSARSSSTAQDVASTPPKQAQVPHSASNAIYIGSSSIDGNVCIASLIDPKDVQLRNFGRPLKSVSLSPEYKSDRSYLSGGLAGNLVLTTGGQSGKSSVSNTSGVGGVSASGWLGALGLGSNAGKDQILHSGEGAISTIKWSLSGMYVAWVNEKGIKIMRSNLHLDAGQSEFAWKRISHIDHPNRAGWDEMAGVWKAHVEWIDQDGLEPDDNFFEPNDTIEPLQNPSVGILSGMNPLKGSAKIRRAEKMVVGWSGTIWIINVHSGGLNTGKEPGERKAGRAEIETILRTDCVISGISLYTPNLLIVLAYKTPEEGRSTKEATPRRGVHRRQNALQPELKIIDIRTNEEVSDPDTLTVSRYEGFSATDYQLGVLPASRVSNNVASSRGALEVIGGGLWDATMYPTRLFSSGASVRSAGSPSERGSSKAPSDANTATGMSSHDIDNAPHPATLTHGMKIFIHSPYDCVLATRTTLADHFSWLTSHARYGEAWDLLDRNPEVVNTLIGDSIDNIPDTPLKTQGSLVDFFEDDSSETTTSARRDFNSQTEKHKRRVGEQWVQQLVSAGDWVKAGQTCGKVLGTSISWEHWVWVFAEAGKFEEITPYVPTTQLRPPLPSLVYEMILGHYISFDRVRFQELLQRWPPDLFDRASIINAIQGQLKSGEIKEDSMEDGEVGRDWRILMRGLAKLYLADGRPSQALKCYIQLQDADTAMDLIAEFHLIDAVSDDIPGFILLRVSKAQQKEASLSELEEATLEPIRLLVDEAHHGIVTPDTVVSQLEKRQDMQQYLFFYFRALWNGYTTSSLSPTQATRTLGSSTLFPPPDRLAASEGRSLVSDHADFAVSLFATYDRPLLMTFLRTSQSYTLETASKICQQRAFIPERVYLLSKEGRLTQALRLIIDHLNDVSQAIAFCKDQNDQSLWDDLLDYSMNKPRFIRGLLEEVGTAINPISLVRRIPAGLEIEGLRDGLSRMIREYEIQHSISEGVARVLRGEVAAAMAARGGRQRKGVKFEVVHSASRPRSSQQQHQQQHQVAGEHPPSATATATATATAGNEAGKEKSKSRLPIKIKPGFCPGCGKPFADDDTQFLVGFSCGHVFHLRCLLRYDKPAGGDGVPDILAEMEAGEAQAMNFDRSIGPKVDHAALLRTMVGDGCPITVHINEN